MNQLIALTLSLLILSLLITTPSALAEITESIILYDANGNRIQDENFFYKYNGFNQLEQVRQGDQSGPILEEYVYDHEGNRLIKREPQKNQNTYYIDRHWIQVVNSEGTFNYTYYWDGDTLVGRKDPDGSKYFYHPDHLGSTTLVTNEAGEAVLEITYEPFGLPIEDSDERFQYTGKELDPGTALYYYGARYYDPRIAQFTQPDSLLPNPYDPQQLNRYAYARDNPYKYTDPSGNVINLGLAVAGVLVGGAAGAIISAVTQYTATGQVSWSDVGKDAGIGAATGGVFGLTFGASAAVLGTGTLATGGSLFTAGAVAGQAGRGAENILEGNDFTDGLGNPTDIAIDGGLAVAGGVAGKAAGKVGEKVTDKINPYSPFKTAEGKFELTKHAIEKAQSEKISFQQITKTIERGEKFGYFHKGSETHQIGYYDPETKIFISTIDGRIPTIGFRSAKSIEKLKSGLE